MPENRLNDRINREDLFTMMASYKNMIETNLILIEKQEKVTSTLEAVKETLNGLISFMKENLNSVDRHHSQCAINQRAYNDDLKTLLRESKERITKNYMNQNIKIFGLITLLCSIILGLIGLVYKLWPVIQIKP